MPNDESERVLGETGEAAVATPAEPATPEEQIARLQAELDRARDEVGQFRSKYLRAEADMQNYRKLVDRQRLEGERAFRRTVLGRFLPVVDNLDRALAQADRGAALDVLLEGVRLTRRGITDVLAAEGVQPIDAAGAPFDPHFHEAVGTAPAPPGAEPNTVVAEAERGYLIDGAVLRPARVIVAGE